MKKISIFSIVILFLLLYYPPIFKTVTLNYLGVISWIYILIKLKFISRRLNLDRLMKLFISLFIITLYLAVIAIINSNSLVILSDYFYWIVDIIPCCIMIADIFIKRRYTMENLIIHLLIVGTIQGVFALLTFMFPSLQGYFLQTLMSFGYSEEVLVLGTFRMYGIATSLNYSTPIFQGFLAIVALFMSINKNIKYVLFIPLLIYSAAINARASIVIMCIGVILIFLPKGRVNVKKFINFMFTSIIGVFIVVVLVMIIEKIAPNTYGFIYEGFEEIKQLLNGDTSGYYYSYITDPSKYVLPKGSGFWFGKGASSMEDYGLQSDIGWINDIWRGGVLYSCMIYYFFIRILNKVRRTNGKWSGFFRFITFYFVLTLVASNFKGFIFSVNEISSLILLIYIFVKCEKQKVDIEPNKES